MVTQSKKLFLLALIPALCFQFVAAYLYFIVFVDATNVATIFTVSKVIIFAWPVLWYLIGMRPQLQHTTRTASIKYGLATGGLAAVVVACVAFITYPVLLAHTGALLEKVNAFGLNNHYILFAIVLSVVHSAFEEYYWRWFVFGGLTHYVSPKTAAWISSIAFASHHFIVLSQFVPLGLACIGTIGVLLAGRVWCWLYMRSGTLWAPWISHILADAAVMTLGYILLF
jgi:membrane protease YdiL (CAAX protease family)